MKFDLQNICVVSVHHSAYSETFIRAHVERLPAKVFHLYGGYMPLYNSEGDLFVQSPFYEIFSGLIFIFARKKNIELIEKYLADNKIKAVLCEYGPCGVEMMEICKKLKLPLYVYFHGYDVYRQKEVEKYTVKYQKLFAIASKIFVVSKHMQNQLIETGAPVEKLIYNPCGADTDLFLPSIPSENPQIFFAAGRFEETKCPQNTIAAFALVAEKFPDALLVMAGTGSLLKMCKTLVRQLKLHQKVKFVGVLSHKSVANQMRKSGIFVQHSVTAKNGDKEGTPVAIMEAGAAGLPVISTKHGGIQDVVIDGVTGILVDEHDINSMAAAMMKMLADPQIAFSMGRAANKRVVESFSQDQSLHKLWTEIEKELDS